MFILYMRRLPLFSAPFTFYIVFLVYSFAFANPKIVSHHFDNSVHVKRISKLTCVSHKHIVHWEQRQIRYLSAKFGWNSIVHTFSHSLIRSTQTHLATFHSKHSHKHKQSVLPRSSHRASRRQIYTHCPLSFISSISLKLGVRAKGIQEVNVYV